MERDVNGLKPSVNGALVEVSRVVQSYLSLSYFYLSLKIYSYTPKGGISLAGIKKYIYVS